MALLELKNINTGYGKKQVLYDISFSVERGEIVLLIGSNGSGKSTLLKAIYGLLPLWRDSSAAGDSSSEGGTIDGGSIRFDGENIAGLPASALLKKGLLYVPQQNNLFADLTVKENLEMAGLTLASRQLLRDRIEKALTVLPTLVPHLKRIPMKLSGGERRLLTLAMAILHQPKMILMDEPFNGLSPQNITFVRENLKNAERKRGHSFSSC